MGITQKKIFYSVRYPEFLVKSLKEGNPSSTMKALEELHSLLRPDKPSTINAARNLLFSRFMIFCHFQNPFFPLGFTHE